MIRRKAGVGMALKKKSAKKPKKKPTKRRLPNDVQELLRKHKGKPREAFRHEMERLKKRIASVEKETGQKVDYSAFPKHIREYLETGAMPKRVQKEYIAEAWRIRKKHVRHIIELAPFVHELQKPTIPFDKGKDDSGFSGDTDFTPQREEPEEPEETEDIYEPDDTEEPEDEFPEEPPYEPEGWEDWGGDDWYDYEPTPSLWEIEIEQFDRMIDDIDDPIIKRIFDEERENQTDEGLARHLGQNIDKFNDLYEKYKRYKHRANSAKYFANEIVKLIRGYGLTKEENMAVTEYEEKGDVYN